MIDKQNNVEQQRRERNWDPAERWKVLQETIAWAEAQRTVRRNTIQACLAEQAKKLAQSTDKSVSGQEEQPDDVPEQQGDGGE